MQQLYDLEINILSCLLLKPELMKDLKLEDKHFIKHQRLWQFMKAFYKRYETFDVVLMFNTCKDKYQIIKYLQWLAEVEPAPSNFYKYQDRLIELYNQNKKDRWIIEEVYRLANELYVGGIDLRSFKSKIEKAEKEAEEKFKEVQ